MDNQYRTNGMFYNVQNHNLCIVKSYFKRPIVLVSAILSIISIIISFALNFIPTGNLANNITSDYFSASGYNIEINRSFIMPNVFAILGIIATILLYANSRKNNNQVTLNAPVVLNRVNSIISLVGTCLLTFLVVVMGVLVAVGLSMSEYYVEYGYVPAVSAAIFLAVLFVLCGLLLFNTISCVIYWNSIKKSLNTPELTSKGAKPYAISNIILAVTEAIMIPVLVVIMIALYEQYGLDSLFVFMSLVVISVGLSVAIRIINAIIAFGYNRHIKYQKDTFSFIPQVPFTEGVDLDRPIGYSFEDDSIKATTNEIDNILQSLDEDYVAEQTEKSDITDAKDDKNVAESGCISQEVQENTNTITEEKISKSGISMDISSMDTTKNPFADNIITNSDVVKTSDTDTDVSTNTNTNTNTDNTNSTQAYNFCPYCGTRVGEAYIYCSRCGKKIR